MKIRLSSPIEEVKTIFFSLKQCIISTNFEEFKESFVKYNQKITIIFYYCLHVSAKINIRHKVFEILLEIINKYLENDIESLHPHFIDLFTMWLPIF